jgi:hypothetical protein
MVRRRGGLLEDDDRRRDQGVAELHVGGAIPVDMQELDALGQVGLHSGAVIDVHEFRGDQPGGKAAGRHPGVAEQEEMGVEPGQAADVEVEAVGDQRLEPLLVRPPQVMVPDVGRIREDQVVGLVGGERGEVPADDPQARACPEASGGVGEGRIGLDAARIGDRPRREGLAQGRVERAGADGGVEERRGRGRPAPPELPGVAGDVEGEGRRRGELPEAIAVGGGPGLVEADLRELALRLDLEHGPIPHGSRSLMRCPSIQSMPSAASWPSSPLFCPSRRTGREGSSR